MGNTSIYLPDDMEAKLESEIPEHMSRSAWIKQAIREKLEREREDDITADEFRALKNKVEQIEEQQNQGLISRVSGVVHPDKNK